MYFVNQANTHSTLKETVFDELVTRNAAKKTIDRAS